jgi:hypothetical protein
LPFSLRAKKRGKRSCKACFSLASLLSLSGEEEQPKARLAEGSKRVEEAFKKLLAQRESFALKDRASLSKRELLESLQSLFTLF